VLRRLNQGLPLSDFSLSIAYKGMPQRVKDVLIRPYLSDDGQQIRFAVRMYESDPGLQRAELLQRIRTDLTSRFDLQPGQVHLTGLMVLYNNVLQSLFRSQAMTLGLVLGATALMFAVLFRSPRLALLALVPNLLAALLVLGSMGAFGISLDIMTITIAAIVLGITVDDSIHYVHRWQDEVQADGDARQAVRRAHASVGRAMVYTTVTVALGFSLFALSAFKPVAYFGVLTGLAMVAALLANLTLLPALLVWARPDRAARDRRPR
jgi:predicted RND superfamily exporter protein